MKEFYPNDALEVIKSGRYFAFQIAQKLECHISTVYDLVMQLRRDGYNITCDRKGYLLLDGAALSSDSIQSGLRWNKVLMRKFITDVVMAQAHLPYAKRIAKEVASKLSIDERREFKSQLITFVRMIDVVDIEEDLA